MFRICVLLALGAYAMGAEYTYTKQGKKAQVGTVVNPAPGPKTDPMEGRSDIVRKPGQNRALDDQSFRWPNGTMPYAFGDITPDAVQACQDAIADFAKYVPCIKIPLRTNEPNYIKFYRKDGCYSLVGMQGGEQEISIGEGCQWKATCIHEMMHALGWEHEQSRVDRDDFIRINWQNVKPGLEPQFTKQDGVKEALTITLTPYCYGSVMHYGPTSFTVNGKNTMDALADLKGQTMGQRQGFADCDLQRIKMYYQCDGKDSKAPLVKHTCTPNGQKYDDGQKFASGAFVMVCSADAQGWATKPFGCLGDDGNCYALGSTFPIQGTLGECYGSGNSIGIRGAKPGAKVSPNAGPIAKSG